MEKVGIFDDVIKVSIPNKEGIWFRTPYTKSNEVLATMKVAKIPKGGLRYNFVATNLGQDELAALILSHAEKLDTFDIRWSHRFAGLKQDENGVTVCAVTPKGEKFFHADYVIACDGAGSSVRRSLCIPFEGITWDVLNLSLALLITGLPICCNQCQVRFRQAWIWRCEHDC
jgi:2-polyprenyl-6-methoxyphenol hydroxylase-like FAD-dependent oxidoreductase